MKFRDYKIVLYSQEDGSSVAEIPAIFSQNWGAEIYFFGFTTAKSFRISQKLGGFWLFRDP